VPIFSEAATPAAALAETLVARRRSPSTVPLPEVPGVYVLFLRSGATLPIEMEHSARVLYVGMTESSLELRDHFTAPSSGFSTIRRSLGALLKDDLTLSATRRGPGPSRSNITNYCFDTSGEQRLSDWMRRSLDVAVYPISDDVRSLEASLINHLRPPLNLTGWKNPQRRIVMALRKACANEAELERR